MISRISNINILQVSILTFPGFLAVTGRVNLAHMCKLSGCYMFMLSSFSA